MYHSTTYPSPVGLITLACDGDNLVGLWNEGQKYHGGAISKAMTEKNDMPVFDTVRHWLDGYFAGEKPDIANLPLAPIGGEFRKEVWDILCGIPYGETVTYGYIAMRTMNYKDAFLEKDVGVKKALAPLPDSPKELLALAEAWRPWRGYATINLWNSLTTLGNFGNR